MLTSYDSWIQRVSPAPKRQLQRVIMRLGLKTGLDIGCGESSPLTPLRTHGFRSIGLDASPTCIERAKRNALHDDYICADVRNLDPSSVNPQPDVVVASHIIEHLTREEGMKFLESVERLAGRLVYIETPLGFLEQHERDGNVFQRHLSGWFIHDFQARGYTVFGGGIRGLRGVEGRSALFPEFLTRQIERGLQWFVFRRPAMAGLIAAIRHLDEQGNVRGV